VIDVEPTAGDGGGYEFINKIVGGKVPREYIPSVDAGIQDAMSAGVLAGYPMVDLRVVLHDGSYHEVDSSEMAFKIAGSMALKEAARRGSPALLEPIMDVEVVTPEEFAGDVMGNLSGRRGHIEKMEPRGNAQVIRAAVPLAEMFGLHHRPALDDAGPGHLDHALRPLRRGAREHCQNHRREDSRGIGEEISRWRRRSLSGRSRI